MNLLLLCIKHADEVDLKENADRYPVEVLQAWKHKQLQKHDAKAGQGWHLTDEEAAEVIDASERATITLQAETIIVGGLGGSALGSAGGGGGAIGPGALGGPGGPVGRIELDGVSAGLPGSAGGGGGVIADGAIQPDSATRPAATEGEGFIAGMDGQDGNESTVSIGDEVVVRASGGPGGIAGTGVRKTTDRLGVSALLLVNYAETRGGLSTIAGGAWQNVRVLNIPSTVNIPIFLAVEAGGVHVGEYTVAVEAHGPHGGRRARVSFPVTVTVEGDVLRIPFCFSLPVEVDAFGLWTVSVSTPTEELARVDVMARRVGEAS